LKQKRPLPLGVAVFYGSEINGPRSHIFEDEEALENNLEEAVDKLNYAIRRATSMIAIFVPL